MPNDFNKKKERQINNRLFTPFSIEWAKQLKECCKKYLEVR